MEATIKAIIGIAFEAGKWAGQVELEEHYDNSQYGDAIVESIYSKKNAMPMISGSKGRTVTVRLRSKNWRKGVIADSEKYKLKAKEMLMKALAEKGEK